MGQFSTAWMANTLIAYTVLNSSGHLDSPWMAVWYGLLINYNIWDAVILKKLKTKTVSEIFAKRYFAFQFLVGTIIEASSYLNLPYAQ
jgi:hypothetical protein